LALLIVLLNLKVTHRNIPLMKKIEAWGHQPQTNRADDQNVDWESLLEPYRNLPADSLEANSIETSSIETRSLEANDALR